MAEQKFYKNVLLNHYKCPVCGHEFVDIYECAVDETCLLCGRNHVSSYLSHRIPVPDITPLLFKTKKVQNI